jgi:hypothetical protein
MPENIRGLYDAIRREGHQQGLSSPQITYAVGWIFYDLFERATHDEQKGVNVTAETLDKYATDLPVGKISRDIDDAQEEFGRVAAAFMEDEIELRIKEATHSSIMKEIKSYTSSVRTFFSNILAGIISGFLFAVILVIMGRIYERDPSPVAISKEIIDGPLATPGPKPATEFPQSPAPAPATLPAKKSPQ